METCFHCGAHCKIKITFNSKSFCCNGCKTVYEIFKLNKLDSYYNIEKNPGFAPELNENKFSFLDNEDLVKQLVVFNESNRQIINLSIPNIHCSSCIWVLEHLNRINKNILSAQVNFPKKKVQIMFNPKAIKLRAVVELLAKIGYPPNITLDDTSKKNGKDSNELIFKIGVAGFAFGNIMFLSFPEYFEVNEFWLEQYKHTFRYIMLIFAIPATFYSGIGYLKSAYKSIKNKRLNIDVPIALGILVLFFRSAIDIIMDWGSGYLDSLSGLIFFLILGKLFQKKTYSFLSFERDYKSYFPIAVTQIVRSNNFIKERQTPVEQIKKNDIILIRNQELIPADGILKKGNALIDYSFVTGESAPLLKKEGDLIYAGGKQIGNPIEVEILKRVDQSYLTRLWSNDIFKKDRTRNFKSLTDQISKHFTLILLGIAVLASSFWIFIDNTKAINVFTSVLIVACPCAIALAAPFTWGNILRYLGRYQFYIKDAFVLEKLTNINTIIFDKTGTLTKNNQNTITYDGKPLTDIEKQLLSNAFRGSNHPLSHALYMHLPKCSAIEFDEYEEITGSGIYCRSKNDYIKIGTYDFVTEKSINKNTSKKTKVFIAINNELLGEFCFKNTYRENLKPLINNLSKTYELLVLSGDNDGELIRLKALFPEKTKMIFNQKPEDKLKVIKELQKNGKRILMIGDGLNDAGALAQSNVGIALNENTNTFTPASDGILDAKSLERFDKFLKLAHCGIAIIKGAFIFSLLYNLIGLGYAISGELKPVVAAILMPLSSISIVVFTTVASFFSTKKILQS